jgi:mRNA-degrading endonuclease YafQ of YafQ-DinJ toxin-antitoxin module
MYEVVFKKAFRKALRKTVRNNPELGWRIGKTLSLLNTNINHRSLKLHKLSGTDYWAVSVSKSYRIKIRIEDKYIFCVGFGSHEEVY